MDSPASSLSSSKRIDSLKIYQDIFEKDPSTEKISQSTGLDESESIIDIGEDLYQNEAKKIESEITLVENPKVTLSKRSIKKSKQKISFKEKTTIKSLHVTILTECLQKLQILGIVGLSEPIDLKHLKVVFKSHKDLINSPYYTTITKFNLDRLFIEDIIFTAIKDLVIHNRVSKFTELVTKVKTESSELLETLNSSLVMKKRVGSLSSAVDASKNQIKREMETFCNELGHLKDLYEDTILENRIKSRYITKWEEARQFQHNMKLKLQLKEIERSVEKAQQDYWDENFVHEQIVAFQTSKKADYWKDIENWSKQFDIDLSNVNLDIHIVTRDKEYVQDQIEKLTKQYESQQKEITDYLIAREVRRENQKLFEKRTTAATKIQAWWRGTMYRHGLGPYRKKKGKKIGKSDKKKK